MFLALQDPKPFIVTVDSGSRRTRRSFGDVIIGALGLAGALIVAALVLGAVLRAACS